MDRTPLRHSAWIARCLGRGELAPLGEEDVALLARQLGEQSHPAGATLFRMGQAPAPVWIVRQGAIELSRTMRGRHVVLQILRPGDVAGDIPLFVRMLEPYDARALEDSVVLSIDSVALFGLLERHPRLAQRWLVSLAQRSADTQLRLVDLLVGGLEAQIASVLIHQAEHEVVRLSQATLADLVGARRTNVNRVLKRFEADRIVRLRYGQVDIVDAPALLDHAGIEDPGVVEQPRGVREIAGTQARRLTLCPPGHMRIIIRHDPVTEACRHWAMTFGPTKANKRLIGQRLPGHGPRRGRGQGGRHQRPAGPG